jgi:hypothetical protein
MRSGDRRLEAENYLSSGYGIRISIESKASGWGPLGKPARVTQPPRTKATHVSPEHGMPFLTATQVFDLRPVTRKWLAVGKVAHAAQLFVKRGQILVTRSGAVGRSTLGFAPHLDTLISDDLLRVEPRERGLHGWLYAYIRAPKVRAMMTGTKYGHIIKHLEVAHINALPIPEVPEPSRKHFAVCVKEILDLRDAAHAATLEAESFFEKGIGSFKPGDNGEAGFVMKSASTLFAETRRLDAWRHSPITRGIVKHLGKGRKTESVAACGYKVWVPGRYKRIPANDGVTFLDSADLFEINPDLPKRFADCRFGDEHRGRVEPGWLLMASSGQTYGIIGGAVLANEFYRDKVIANHVIRIAATPTANARPGYLLTALTHPTLGRPVVKSFAFGSSVPEIAPEDVEAFPVVRLPSAEEDAIADLAERSAKLRAQADLLENEIAAEAEALLDRFIAGKKLTVENEESSLRVAEDPPVKTPRTPKNRRPTDKQKKTAIDRS